MSLEQAHARLKKILSAFTTILLVCTTALALCLVLQTTLQGEVSLFGYRLYYIVTGSMEPTIPVGSLIVVKLDEDTLYEVGEVITFVSQDAAISGYANTHRVVAVEEIDGGTYYTTKGDANNSADTLLVPQEDVIGKMVLQIGAAVQAGSFLAFVGTRWGFVLCVIAPVLLVTMFCLRDFTRAYRAELAASKAQTAASLPTVPPTQTLDEAIEKAVQEALAAQAISLAAGVAPADTVLPAPAEPPAIQPTKEDA